MSSMYQARLKQGSALLLMIACLSLIHYNLQDSTQGDVTIQQPYYDIINNQSRHLQPQKGEKSYEIELELAAVVTHPAKTDESQGGKQSEIKTEPVTTPTTTEPVYNAEREMNRNAEYTNQVCQSLTDKEKRLFYEGLERSWVSRTWTSNTSRFSLLFTPIPKCGWTTWQVLFYKDAGKLESIRKDSRWAWGNDYHDVDLVKTLIGEADTETYKDRLLMVRHPYERLVSAYNDKALRDNGLYTKSYHNPCSWLTIQSNATLTFPQFVQCILIKARNRSASISSRKSGIWLDHHWAPQSHLSLPCRANYTMIGKYDRFQDNSNFMIKRLKLNATLTVNNHRSKGKALDYWYNQLSIEQVKQLQILYRYDFLLFGFDSTPPGHNHTKEVKSKTAEGQPQNKTVSLSSQQLSLNQQIGQQQPNNTEVRTETATSPPQNISISSSRPVTATNHQIGQSVRSGGGLTEQRPVSATNHQIGQTVQSGGAITKQLQANIESEQEASSV